MSKENNKSDGWLGKKISKLKSGIKSNRAEQKELNKKLKSDWNILKKDVRSMYSGDNSITEILGNGMEWCRAHPKTTGIGLTAIGIGAGISGTLLYQNLFDSDASPNDGISLSDSISNIKGLFNDANNAHNDANNAYQLGVNFDLDKAIDDFSDSVTSTWDNFVGTSDHQIGSNATWDGIMGTLSDEYNPNNEVVELPVSIDDMYQTYQLSANFDLDSAMQDLPAHLHSLTSPAKTYIVKDGDSLWKIADDYITNNNLDISVEDAWRDIAADNNIPNPNFIEMGDKLTIDFSNLTGYSPEVFEAPTYTPIAHVSSNENPDNVWFDDGGNSRYAIVARELNENVAVLDSLGLDSIRVGNILDVTNYGWDNAYTVSDDLSLLDSLSQVPDSVSSVLADTSYQIAETSLSDIKDCYHFDLGALIASWNIDHTSTPQYESLQNTTSFIQPDFFDFSTSAESLETSYRLNLDYQAGSLQDLMDEWDELDSSERTEKFNIIHNNVTQTISGIDGYEQVIDILDGREGTIHHQTFDLGGHSITGQASFTDTTYTESVQESQNLTMPEEILPEFKQYPISIMPWQDNINEEFTQQTIELPRFSIIPDSTSFAADTLTQMGIDSTSAFTDTTMSYVSGIIAGTTSPDSPSIPLDSLARGTPSSFETPVTPATISPVDSTHTSNQFAETNFDAYSSTSVRDVIEGFGTPDSTSAVVTPLVQLVADSTSFAADTTMSYVRGLTSEPTSPDSSTISSDTSSAFADTTMSYVSGIIAGTISPDSLSIPLDSLARGTPISFETSLAQDSISNSDSTNIAENYSSEGQSLESSLGPDIGPQNLNMTEETIVPLFSYNAEDRIITAENLTGEYTMVILDRGGNPIAHRYFPEINSDLEFMVFTPSLEFNGSSIPIPISEGVTVDLYSAEFNNLSERDQLIGYTNLLPTIVNKSNEIRWVEGKLEFGEDGSINEDEYIGSYTVLLN
ncbi:MAG: LysM peptidoglycan-binding domain-containing protein [Nanoarchaeota archaeon]|nr:LysM peptidoglycan-binding domain-containing protein [Nanoarchaeota archaeon]